MDANHSLLIVTLLGGIAFGAHAQTIEPAAVAPQDAAIVAPEGAEAGAVTPVAEVTVAQAPSPVDAAAPEWERLIQLKTQLQPGANGQPIGDKALRLVQRSTTGKVLATQAAVSILGGGAFGFTFKKDQLKGTRVDTVPNPAFDYLQGKLHASLAAYFTAHPGALPAKRTLVQVTAQEFSLIYKELGNAETEYQLSQSTHVGFPYRRKLLALSGGEGVQCTVAEPQSASLQAWQADDYALVKQTAQRYTDDCLARFVAQLPVLFPDTTAAETVGPVAAPVAPAEASAAEAAEAVQTGQEA